MPLPNHLLEEDFQGDDTSAEKAREAFAGLQCLDEVMAVLQELQDTTARCLAEGRGPAAVVESAHMVFTGPPGTGKTTVARRMGTALHQLGLCRGRTWR